jgi:hypothetical protein
VDFEQGHGGGAYLSIGTALDFPGLSIHDPIICEKRCGRNAALEAPLLAVD